MKKHFIAFMMPFLTLATGFAQEAAQDVPVKQDTKEISYWTDPASGDKRLLNKSKFRDNSTDKSRQQTANFRHSVT